MTSENRLSNRKSSFQKQAARHAIWYLQSRLKLKTREGLPEYKLSTEDGAAGLNFLESFRSEILHAVITRSRAGKGVTLPRTTRHLLASQAMCFNLFVPLRNNLRLAADWLRGTIPDLESVCDIEIEHTPAETILGDQTRVSGVDCDVLITFRKSDSTCGIIVIETKYVEPGFSKCGHRPKPKPVKQPRTVCYPETFIVGDGSNCAYQQQGYKYWQVTRKGQILDSEKVLNGHCPFGGDLWQLWTNLALARGIASSRCCSEYHYAVISPAGKTVPPATLTTTRI